MFTTMPMKTITMDIISPLFELDFISREWQVSSSSFTGGNLKDDKALGSTLLLMLNVSIANLNNELKKTQTKMKHNCYTLIKDNSNVHFFSSAPAANEQEATENGQAIAHLYKETSKSI